MLYVRLKHKTCGAVMTSADIYKGGQKNKQINQCTDSM